jgi:hypothetical protein
MVSEVKTRWIEDDGGGTTLPQAHLTAEDHDSRISKQRVIELELETRTSESLNLALHGQITVLPPALSTHP